MDEQPDRYDHALLESLLRRAGLAVAFWDTELRFVRINENAAGPNGLPPGEHVGRTFAEVVGPVVAAAAEPKLREVLETRASLVDTEIRGEWPDGGARVYLTTFFPIETDDGELVGVGAIGLETTTVVERELETAVRATEYERALADYAALVRHRLATPLTAIRGAAETLRARPDLPPGTRAELLDLIAAQGELLERLALDPSVADATEAGLRPRPSL